MRLARAPGHAAGLDRSWQKIAKVMWTSGVPKGCSQLAGALASKLCRTAARAAIPCLNSIGKLSSRVLKK